jgi:hypothetical protein
MPVRRLPVNVAISLFALLLSFGIMALLGHAGVLDAGDPASAFANSVVLGCILLAPVMVVQLALASGPRASRRQAFEWPARVVLVLAALAALLGAGLSAVVFLALVPLIAGAAFWVAGEPLPRRRLALLAALSLALAVVALAA